MITKAKKKELMADLGPQTPSVIVGRNGLSDSVIGEIVAQLKAKKAIKIALPAQLEDKDAFVQDICEKTNSICVDLRGRKAILFRE